MSRRVALELLGRIRVGTLTVIDGGRRYVFGSGAPAATVTIHSDRVWPMLFRGSRGLAESYAQGLWDSPDLVAVIRLGARNVVALDRVRAALTPLRAPIQIARGAIARNTRVRSRRDIAAHYDLGNELFSRMLDPTMSYSCALFERPGMTLEEAQVAKLEQICDKLELRPEDHLVEIGTGWGGLAIHAAATRGCRVTTTTISREQREYALAEVQRAGLADRVEIRLQDYRDLRGQYDKLVSVEMIEAVGWQHFGAFFAKCSELLAPHGAMLLQAITIDDSIYEAEKGARSFANTHVFPGGCLPSKEAIADCVRRVTSMREVWRDDITAHYPPTLAAWRERFLGAWERLRPNGYDERFRRLWDFYLSSSEAGFRERRIGDVQALFAKPGWS